MPNIREFETPSLGIRPDDRGMEATASSGQRIKSYYNQAAGALEDVGRSADSAIRDVGTVALKHAEHQEISKGAAVSANALSGLDQLWNQTAKNADPSDPTVRAKFMEQNVEPQLEKLRDAFNTEGGQKFAESQIESIRNHFVTKTAADMSSLAAIAVKNNYTTTVNTLSNTVRTDPSSLGTALKTVDSSVSAIADSSPNLDAVTSARVKGELALSAKSEIVKSAAIGAIAINPQAGLAKFSAPEFSKYISGTELQQLTQQAKAVQRAERVDESYQRTLQEQAKKDASDARVGEYLSKLHSGDPKEASTVSAKTIANDFTLTREARERMIGMVKRETEPETASAISNATTVDLIRRIRLPAGNPERIDSLDPVYQQMVDGKLNKTDLKFVRDEFINSRSPDGEALSRRQADFVAGVKPYIVTSGPMSALDPSQSEQLYRFTLDLQKKVEEYRKAGKDPRDLMDPSKPEYMGGPAALVPYQKTMQEVMRNKAEMLKRSNTNLTAPGTIITGVQVENAPVNTSVARPKSEAVAPKIGEVRDGYEFVGGSPGAATSWRRVGNSPTAVPKKPGETPDDYLRRTGS